jgi:DMSO/TMAO reductase YedYZ heme-binding membrane subunit
VEAASARDRPATSGPAGWPIVGCATLVLVLLTLTVFAVAGTGEAGMRMLLRATARSSALLFAPVFAASALQRRLRTEWTRWLLANRRYLGVSFAVSHLIHLGAIIGLARAAEEAKFYPTTVVLGGFGFVVIAAMTATSFDRTAAWLGRTAWRRLHTFGVYYVWFIFIATFAPKVGHEWEAVLMTLMLVAALGLRLWPARRP